MANDRDDELNNGGAPGGDDFSLEEILAEYGDGKRPPTKEDTIPFPVLPTTRRTTVTPPPKGGGKVVTFPGMGELPSYPPPVEREPEPPCSPPSPEVDEEDDAPEDDLESTRVLTFPGEGNGKSTDNPIAEQLNRILRKADEYAEHMFEAEGTEDNDEVRRAEEYIPGVDEEAPVEDRRERRPRRQPPPAPDLPPADLARRYQRGLKLLRLRSFLVFLLALPQAYLSLAPFFGLPPLLEADRGLLLYVMAGLMGLALLLGIDVLGRGLLRLLRLQMGMDTLLVFACAATLADTLTMQTLNPRDGQLPYCAVAVLALAFTMRGAYLKRRGSRLACRTAASAATPYLVTLDEGTWNGRDTYAKWSGEPIGFGRQIQADDGAQRIFYVVCPLLFIACLLLSLISSVGKGRPENLLWCLSAMLCAAGPLSAALCFSIPWQRLCTRLSKGGAAIAGWDGVTATTGGRGILLSDTDLFPPGAVSLNGIKIFGSFPTERVVGYTATLIRDSGSGLEKIFHDLLRSQGAIFRHADDFSCYEGGGLSATIRGDQVLVGSAAFMHLMDVTLPQGLNVKNAVFCAIDGDLAGIFALNYTLHGVIEPSLHALIHNHVTPVLVTRDFNLIPSMLRQRFKLPVDRMDFPAVDRRIELSDRGREHSPILSAVLCREGVGPYSEAVVGAARLRQGVRGAATLTCLGALVGLLLAFYLTFVASYVSLSPANLLIFLVMWLIPPLLVSGWVERY